MNHSLKKGRVCCHFSASKKKTLRIKENMIVVTLLQDSSGQERQEGNRIARSESLHQLQQEVHRQAWQPASQGFSDMIEFIG
jgi:hypothetical protein